MVKNALDISKRKKLNIQSLALYIGTISIVIVFTILCEIQGKNFLSVLNISNILVQSSIIAICAIGASLVILTGGIDLSVGAIVGLVGVASGLLIKGGTPIPIALIIGALIGCAFGIVNGIGVSRFKIPAFIMTLGTLGIARGITLALSGGKPVANFPLELSNIANIPVLGIPSFIIYVIVLYAITMFVMKKMKFGRYVYAIGGNAQAARLAGIDIKKIETITYALAGVFGAIGGIMLLSRLSYASPTAGTGYELDAIAAAVVGGMALSGGQGKLGNTLVGALILGILKTGLQMLDLAIFFQQIAIGVVIIGAVYFDKAKERKAA